MAFLRVVLALVLLGVFAGLPSRAVAEKSSPRAVSLLNALEAKRRALRWTFEIGPSEAMEQQLSQITGFIVDPQLEREAMYVQAQRVATLPKNFDWRDEAGGLPPIKNQKNCGSCWAFGTVAVLESLLRIRDGVYKNFSEQQLVSCNRHGWGCNGGYFAHGYHVTPGAAFSEDFPYKALDVSCKSSLNYPYKIESWGYVGSSGKAPTVEQLKTALYEYGPLAVTVAASGSFQAYKSGIYNANDSYNINHLVNLVGWNSDGGYWIMRNSWGESWGESGYMRIKYGVNRIANQATFAVYKTACNPQPVAYVGTSSTQKIPKGSYARIGGMAVPGHTYEWTPSAGLDEATSASALASPEVTTTYTLKVKNTCGVAHRSVTVEVLP